MDVVIRELNDNLVKMANHNSFNGTRAETEALEDMHFENKDELYQFVEAWNKRNELYYFEVAEIIIEIPEDIRKEYENS